VGCELSELAISAVATLVSVVRLRLVLRTAVLRRAVVTTVSGRAIRALPVAVALMGRLVTVRVASSVVPGIGEAGSQNQSQASCQTDFQDASEDVRFHDGLRGIWWEADDSSRRTLSEGIRDQLPAFVSSHRDRFAQENEPV
jgi:hypothetical protein